MLARSLGEPDKKPDVEAFLYAAFARSLRLATCVTVSMLPRWRVGCEALDVNDEVETEGETPLEAVVSLDAPFSSCWGGGGAGVYELIEGVCSFRRSMEAIDAEGSSDIARTNDGSEPREVGFATTAAYL